MKPSKNIISITKNKAEYFPPGNISKTKLINPSPPTPLKIRENIDAPIRIVNTMVVTKAVLLLASFISSILNFLKYKHISIEPTAPTPAASVGVAIPKIIDPKTIKINKIGGSRVFSKEIKLTLLSF